MSTPPTFPDPLGKRATPRRTCGAGRRRPGALLPPLLPCPQPRPRLPVLRKFLGLDPTCPRRCTRPSCTTVQGKGRWQGELRLKGQALIPRAPHVGISLRRWLVGQDKSGIGKKKKSTVCKRCRFKTHGPAWSLGAGHGWVTGTRRMCFNSTPLSPKLVGELG